MSSGRLSLWQAAYVIARRDFVAVLFSRAFFFFLLGPLFPIVVGAMAGGIGQEVARALGVRAIFAERQDGMLTLRRGFSLARGERVLVVEDVVTTGGSTRETIDVARAAGANVVGAAAIIDRSGGNQALDVPFHALATVSLPTYQPDACPLCARGEPVSKPGSRA